VPNNIGVQVKLRKEIKENGIIVVLIPKSEYAGKIKGIVKDTSKIQGKLCYVSLNRPYKFLVPVLKSASVDIKKIIFIDSATSGFSEPKDGLKVVIVSSPKALTELNIAMNKIIEKEKVKSVLFDSLSTLLVYEQSHTVIKFSHSVITKLRSTDVKGVFLALKEDTDSELIKDLSMFADKIVEI
jgi:hypothetical protein